jgi:hypothetical protein
MGKKSVACSSFLKYCPFPFNIIPAQIFLRFSFLVFPYISFPWANKNNDKTMIQEETTFSPSIFPHKRLPTPGPTA